MGLHHIKPHAALYGRAARDEAAAGAGADAAAVFGVPCFGMARTLHESVYTAQGWPSSPSSTPTSTTRTTGRS